MFLYGALIAPYSSSQEINSALMQSTFRISGPPDTKGSFKYGTGFLLIKSVATGSATGFYVLVTAAHVLDEINGDFATITLRQLTSDSLYEEVPYKFRIRGQFGRLYYKSPEADVAVAYISFTNDFRPPGIPASGLVTDSRLIDMNLHPGDELFTLGFPLQAELNTFPVLRSGVMASYPITPMKKVQRLFMNFRVFEGNSGGPVYFSYITRTDLKGDTSMGVVQGILGLVIGQFSSSASGNGEVPLDISEIVPSIYISDAIDALGARSTSHFVFTPAGPASK
jgi:hypothetical protein